MSEKVNRETDRQAHRKAEIHTAAGASYHSEGCADEWVVVEYVVRGKGLHATLEGGRVDGGHDGCDSTSSTSRTCTYTSSTWTCTCACRTCARARACGWHLCEVRRHGHRRRGRGGPRTAVGEGHGRTHRALDRHGVRVGDKHSPTPTATTPATRTAITPTTTASITRHPRLAPQADRGL